jgi:serine/threonine protein kinase
MAPEIWADPPIYSKACDIFSFAILANELLTEKRPSIRIQANQRPNLFDGMEDHGAINLDLQELITKCWHEDRLRRPLFSSVSMRLRQFCQSFGDDPRDTLRAMFTSQSITSFSPDSSDATDYSSMGPVMSRLNEEYLRAYRSDDLDRAEVLESLRNEGRQIFQNLLKARKTLNDARQAIHPIQVVRTCKAKVTELEECMRKFEQAAEVHTGALTLGAAIGGEELGSDAVHGNHSVTAIGN